MNGKPLVSIVIPVYNGSDYLRVAIDSALAQTYRNIEVLVVNDGSRDDGRTETVALGYGERIRYLPKENGGVSSALNLGIREMRGELFSWLSHDDVYYPWKTEREVAYLADHPETSVVGCGLDIIDAGGAVVSSHSTERVVQITNGRELMDNWVYGCSLLIRREFFDKAGPFDEENRTIQDLVMWLRMLTNGATITLIPDRLCQWRRHGGMGSHTLRPLVFLECEAFFAGLLDHHPLSFFVASSRDAATRQGRAETYEWLGEQARHRGASRMSTVFFRRAILADPNPMHPVFRRVARKYLSRLVRGGRDPV